MASNGRLPQSSLGPITKAVGGAQVYLRKDAAKAFMAMNHEAETKYGTTLRATGSKSAYRTLAQQEWLWDNVEHPHDTNWVARPGTSNHGWGLAIDLASPHMRSIVDKIGAKYGWSKHWSDAPGEWWHLKWKPGNYPAVKNSPASEPTLRRGQIGPSVIRMKKLLYNKGLRFGSRYNPFFGKKTQDAVKRFQKRHSLKADGVVGTKTWRALKAR